MRFQEKVRALLKARRLSQSELAATLGTSQPQVSRWLESDTPPRWDYLLKLARALGVTVDYLIDPEQAEPARPPELPEDERYLLQLYRDLRLSRDEAARGLAGMARPAVPRDPAAEPRGTAGTWVPGAVRDLTESEVARRRQRSRGTDRDSKTDPHSQDEGTDPEHSPRRIP